MKALTIRQPWASLIAAGVKTIETRPWRTSYRGPLAIHAGLQAGPVLADLPQWRKMADCLQLNEAQFCVWRDSRPRGAIVATAELVDCVPMVHTTQPRDGHCLVVGPPPRYRLTLHGAPTDPGTDVSGQLPLGDFAPGRWAWLLVDIKPTTERCPWCWGRGHRCRGCDACTGSGGVGHDIVTCPTCGGAKTCDPIPARGKQGLWNWEAS